MKTINHFYFVLAITLGLFSCSSIKTSRYAAFNQFHYANEQPRFNFQNDTLKIQGAWSWANDARAIPQTSYLPKTIQKILKPIAKEHGAVLFPTWTPDRKKYSKEGDVPVTKKDVQYVSEISKPFFVIVLVNDHAFKADTSRYKPRGTNYDTQFEIYLSAPLLATPGYWVTEVIAASNNRYYDFVSIADESYMSDPEKRAYQADRFLEDIQHQFLTK